MNTDINKYLEKRLEEWADWCLRYNTGNIGYPRKSILALLIEGGGEIIKSTAPRTIPDNHQAEEIEKLICDMHQQNSHIAQALKVEYLTFSTKEQKAKRLHISRSIFITRVNMAKQWLLGRLSAHKTLLRAA